jgi:hypothetical protein
MVSIRSSRRGSAWYASWPFMPKVERAGGGGKVTPQASAKA